MAEGQVSEASVRQVLDRFQDPETGRSVVQLGQIHRLDLADGRLAVTLGLTSWSAPLQGEIRDELAALLGTAFPRLEVRVDVEPHDRPAEKIGQVGLAAKSVIAVGSGKGGVGKSSMAAALAYSLSQAGCHVGLMDADIYGPSIPHLIGTTARPQMSGELIQPVVVDGLKVMSIGLMVPPGDAVIWRGPMLHGALTQFLRDTDWGELDYLIVDMPPGTGDVALSLAQLLPGAGAVVVCTPQDVALLDAVKAVAMFRKVNIDVLGMIENMSFFLCPDCHSRHEIFGSGGARRKAAELDVAFLGEVPLNTQFRVLGDEGRVGQILQQPEAKPYLDAICRGLVRNLVQRHRQQPTLPGLSVLNP